VKSKREIVGFDEGGGGDVEVWVGAGDPGTFEESDEDAVGCGLGDLNIVCDPDDRNIPPPTRDERVFLASSNDFGGGGDIGFGGDEDNG